MSADSRWVAEAISSYSGKGGWTLDLGRGHGTLRGLIERNGWRYVDLDLRPETSCAAKGHAHLLPFRDETVTLIVLKDAREHFEEPKRVMREVSCACQSGGVLIIWVPFLWPFYGDDYYG